MRYVVDANVVIKWFIPEIDSDKADRLLADFRSHRLDVVAPDILVAEVGSTLWKRSVKTKDISLAEAAASFTDFLDLGVPLQSSSAIAEEALNIANAVQHAVYDTLYVSLALKNRCEFITADEKLFQKFSPKYPVITLLRTI